MDLIKKLIAFVMKLLGRDDKSLGPGLSDAEKSQLRSDAIKGLDEVSGAENIHVHGTGAGA